MHRILKPCLILLCLTMSGTAVAATLVKDKMWPANTTLNVVFIDGDERQRNLVKAFAPLWLEGSSLKFAFFDGWQQAPEQTHIRISFRSHTGSRLGRHSDLSSKEPTLLLAELQDPQLPEDFARRLILHEFGHALGFEHEYRNPQWPYGQAPIEQQIKSCIPRMQDIGYTQAEAQQKCYETNRILESQKTNATIYDEYSIMNYPQTIDLGNNLSKEIKAKTKLSVLDILAMERWYK